MELAALQKVTEQFQKLGAKLIAISPQKDEFTQQMRDKNHLSFDVLSDKNNEVAHKYGIVFTLAESIRPVYSAIGIDLPAMNDSDTFTLPVPATYVIQTDGTIAFSFVNIDYSQRAEPSDVLTILEKLNALAP